MKFGYARVSSLAQDLTVQIKELEKEECSVIYEEKFTGTKMDRPEFNQLVEVLQEGDTLVVTKLDRLARNVTEGIEAIQGLFKKNVKVHVLNVGLLENTTMGSFFLNMMLAVAEMERNMIVERTQEGKAIARQKPGWREGRKKKFKRAHIDSALKMKEDENLTWSQIEEKTNIGRRTLQRALQKEKAETLLNEYDY